MIGGRQLWERARETSRAAIASGALLPIATHSERVEDAGVSFLVRVVDSLARKDEARTAVLEGRAVKPTNPFLPYDPELWVGDVSATHVCLLNKYNVLDDHLLLVTRAFEAQERLLTPADFEALWLCMQGVDALGFYNGGKVAGASQGHKHLQVVPIGGVDETGVLPVESVMPGDASLGRVLQIPSLGFPHAWVGVQQVAGEGAADASLRLWEQHLALLRAVGAARQGREEVQAAPYNLLLTRSWMLAVPREAEFFAGISINALGFAGCLLVRNDKQLEEVRAAGPMRMLQHVASRS